MRIGQKSEADDSLYSAFITFERALVLSAAFEIVKHDDIITRNVRELRRLFAARGTKDPWGGDPDWRAFPTGRWPGDRPIAHRFSHRFQRRAPLAQHFPRVPWDRVIAGDPAYAQYTDIDNWDGTPFILTHATNDWKTFPQWINSAKKWHDYLVDLLGANAHSTLYPNGLLDGPEEAESVALDRSLHELFIVPGRDQQTSTFETRAHGTAPSKWPFKPAFLPARYTSMKLNIEAWDKLQNGKHLPHDRPHLLQNDDPLRCLTDTVLLNEFYVKTSWKMFILGVRGSGMRNHTDSLRTSS